LKLAKTPTGATVGGFLGMGEHYVAVERHWPSLCIVSLLLALSVVAVVEVCADATPVINAVLNNAITIYLDFMVSSSVSRNNTGCSALVSLVGKGCARCGWMITSRRRMASKQLQEQFGRGSS
jgi:hypothetical protein